MIQFTWSSPNFLCSILSRLIFIMDTNTTEIGTSFPRQRFWTGVWLNSVQIMPHAFPTSHLYKHQNFINMGNVKYLLQFQAHIKLLLPSDGHKFHHTIRNKQNPTFFVFLPEIHFSITCQKDERHNRRHQIIND